MSQDERMLSRSFRAAREAVRVLERENLFSGEEIKDETKELAEIQRINEDARFAILALQASGFSRLEDGSIADGVAATIGCMRVAAVHATSGEWRSLPIGITSGAVVLKIVRRLIDSGELSPEIAANLRREMAPLAQLVLRGQVLEVISRTNFALNETRRTAGAGTIRSEPLRQALSVSESKVVEDLQQVEAWRCCQRMLEEAHSALRVKQAEAEYLEVCERTIDKVRNFTGCTGWGEALANELQRARQGGQRFQSQFKATVEELDAIADPERGEDERDARVNGVYRYRTAARLISQVSEEPSSIKEADEAALKAVETVRFDPDAARCDPSWTRFIHADLTDRLAVGAWLASRASAMDPDGASQVVSKYRDAVRRIVDQCRADASVTGDLVARILESALVPGGNTRTEDTDGQDSLLSRKTLDTLVAGCTPMFLGLEDRANEGKQANWLVSLDEPHALIVAMVADATFARRTNRQPTWKVAGNARLVEIMALAEVSQHVEELAASMDSEEGRKAIQQAIAAMDLSKWWSDMKRSISGFPAHQTTR